MIQGNFLARSNGGVEGHMRCSFGARYRVAAALSILALALSACSGSDAQPLDLATRAAKLLPANERLATLYAQSCRQCHASGVNAAPLTGNPRDWNIRLEKGLVRMSQSVQRGTEHMPAGGNCKTCSREDVVALIGFMAGRGGSVIEQ